MYHICHKINLNRGGSFVDLPYWIKNKYKWEGVKFTSEKDDWTAIQKNNVTIALNVLYGKKEKIYPTFVSKNNLSCKKQVILLVISNKKRKAISEG